MYEISAAVGDEEFLRVLNRVAGESGTVLKGKSLDACFASVPYYELRVERILSVARAIILNHPFVDGNKRTAVLFITGMVGTSGLNLNKISKEDWATMVVAVATEHWTVAQMRAWLLKNLD
jgi:fido (protein-threonine AMPylation protein)